MKLELHPDRLLPREPDVKAIARELFDTVENAPIISPHGHTDPAWFANNEPFDNAAELLVIPDHYLLRMLYSQGVSMQAMGINPDSEQSEVDYREVWRTFTRHYHLFRGTPSRIWLNHVFSEVFGFEDQLDASTADDYFDAINEKLKANDFLPRNLFNRFNIEALATTEGALDPLLHHKRIQDSDWSGRVITTFRPDAVVDPEHEGFADNLSELANLTGEDTGSWQGYLAALRNRREFFKAHGATATDHGHPSPATANLDEAECQQLLNAAIKGHITAEGAELFRAQMLTEMATMSLDDGLVMQIHPGSFRNHNSSLFTHFGRDKGADIPVQTEYVRNLKPLLDKIGNNSQFTLILFTLDETVYSRELAPLAGHYPCLKLGPAWWFHDSTEGMRRFRQQTTETAGFYNTVGFNDDTRAFLSIPARHDVARRIDAGYLAGLVTEHQLSLEEAHELIQDLTVNLVKQAYRL